jgi:hypothetical protein
MFSIRRLSNYLDKRDCYECIYNISSYYNGTITSRCILYKYNSVSDKKEKYDYSSAVRSDPNKCGTYGKYYVNKKDVFDKKTETK